MSPDPLLGQSISHYRILERLGEGGMGVVYLAEDLTLKRRVALKFLPVTATADPEARARLVHEAQAAASLLHPNICPVYEIAEADGQTFIAMAHLEGKTLRERLAEGPVPLAEALSIARQIGEGLAAAHAKGIVHRDVKPGNVMLLPDGRPVLMDFGLAHVAGGTKLTRTGTTLGTAAYMSPEQARGEAADARSDIWALGVVVYELVSGRLPFTGKTEIALLYAIVSAEPEPLTAVARNVPAGLNGIVTKALAKEAGRRYASAAEMVADLGALERDVTAEPAGKGRRTRRRRAWLTAAVVLGAVALLVALTLLNVGGLRERLFEGGPRIRSIAVLPLANLSGDASQEYFADGVTEALINDLGKVSALRVISRTSAMGYKGTKKALKEIAKELHVDAIVEGSVIRSGERVKISAQLIRAAGERQVWADAFERELKDVLILQDEMAGTIAGAVRAKLTAGERARLASAKAVNPEAQEAYLKARYYWNQMTEESTRQAIAYAERAIQIDPNYGPGHMVLAQAYYQMGAGGWDFAPPKEMFPRAKSEALKALELDPNCSDAYDVLESFLAGYEYDLAGADSLLRLALELHPNNVLLLVDREQLDLLLGRNDEAVTAIKRAVDLDPLVPFVRANLVGAFCYTRQYDRAVAAAAEALHRDPNFWVTHWILGDAFMGLRRLGDAIREYDRAVALSAGNPNTKASLGWAYAVAGRRPDALRVLSEFDSLSTTRYVPAYCRAVVYAGLGDKDLVFHWLNQAAAERSSLVPFLRVSQPFDGVRSDPRYLALMSLIRFPRH